MLWLDLSSFFFRSCGCLREGVIISVRLVQVRTSPKHRSTYISNYQSNERESNKHDESDQMEFSCVHKNALRTIRDFSSLSFATKSIGLPCYTFVTVTITCSYLAIKLSVTDNFCACRHYLPKNRLSFPYAPRWVRHSYLSKGLRQIPYTCGLSHFTIFGPKGMHCGVVIRSWVARVTEA